jgi:hypothetical protein
MAIIDFDSAGDEWLVIEAVPAAGVGVWVLMGDL